MGLSPMETLSRPVSHLEGVLPAVVALHGSEDLALVGRQGEAAHGGGGAQQVAGPLAGVPLDTPAAQQCTLCPVVGLVLAAAHPLAEMTVASTETGRFLGSDRQIPTHITKNK